MENDDWVFINFNVDRLLSTDGTYELFLVYIPKKVVEIFGLDKVIKFFNEKPKFTNISDDEMIEDYGYLFVSYTDRIYLLSIRFTNLAELRWIRLKKFDNKITELKKGQK